MVAVSAVKTQKGMDAVLSSLDSFCAVEDTSQGMVPPRVDASSYLISSVMVTPQVWPKSVSPGTLDLSKLPAKTVITGCFLSKNATECM